MLPSSAPPDPELVEVIAADLGVDPAFIEKDWYAVRLAALAAGVAEETAYPVFSGGTSLSKAYGLIRRFSEDLDFKFACRPRASGRGRRRAFRQKMVEAVRSDDAFTLPEAAIQSGDESRFFKCQVTYRNVAAPSTALRPHLQLEVTFDAPTLPVVHRPLASFVALARREPPEVAAVACVSPVETAADKLSALTWRVLTRRRGMMEDDPTLIRHMHDLAALEATAAGDPGFGSLFWRTVDRDAGRGSPSEEIRSLPAVARLERMLARLRDDPAYRAEYERFVVGMSYARADESPSFEAALESLSDCVLS